MFTAETVPAEYPDAGDATGKEASFSRNLSEACDHAEEIRLLIELGRMERCKDKSKQVLLK